MPSRRAQQHSRRHLRMSGGISASSLMATLVFCVWYSDNDGAACRKWQREAKQRETVLHDQVAELQDIIIRHQQQVCTPYQK
jgi:hypothetical protein